MGESCNSPATEDFHEAGNGPHGMRDGSADSAGGGINNSNAPGPNNNGLLRTLGTLTLIAGLMITVGKISFNSGYWAGEHDALQRCMAEKFPLPDWYFGGPK